MINRDDMLELTRRMTPARSSIDRVAGAYFDEDGLVDGTFNTHFLKLSGTDKSHQLSIAKDVIFSDTNVHLKDYRIQADAKKPGSIWQLLDGMKECGLKNDAFLDILYELIGERYHPGSPFAFEVFHGRYDIPRKGTDKEWIEGSEEVYEYLIGALCPLGRDYVAGPPEFGFLYPAFRDRGADNRYVNIFEANPKRPHASLMQLLL